MSKPQFSSKKFGELLNPGDLVVIEYHWPPLENVKATRFIAKEVERFDGVEYRFKGLGCDNNLNHSGYIVNSENSFSILVNQKPFATITRIKEDMELSEGQKEALKNKNKHIDFEN